MAARPLALPAYLAAAALLALTWLEFDTAYRHNVALVRGEVAADALREPHAERALALGTLTGAVLTIAGRIERSTRSV